MVDEDEYEDEARVFHSVALCQLYLDLIGPLDLLDVIVIVIVRV